MTNALLIENGIIITLGRKNRVLRGYSILCEDGVIRKIAPSAEFNEIHTCPPFSKGGERYGGTVTSPVDRSSSHKTSALRSPLTRFGGEGGVMGTSDTPASRVIDAAGKVVMPGFINAHMHFYSTMARGLIKAASSKDFNEVLENLWWRLDKKLTLEDCYYSALVPLLDAVRHGTTTLIDHHASPRAIEGSLATIADAVGKVGVRASLCYEVSDRDGPKAAREGIEENVQFVRTQELRALQGKNQTGKSHPAPPFSKGGRGDFVRSPGCVNSGEPSLLRGLFGLHASFTLSDKTLEAAADAGKKLGAGFHIHVAEAESDEKHCVKKHKMRVVERLHKADILGPRTIAAHCVYVDDREMRLLAETGTAVAHNPQSNMNNAVGVARILRMMKKGMLVGLGTDAMTVNMLEEMRCGIWAQRLANKNPSVAFGEGLTALLYSNAAIANRYWDCGLGALEEGRAADIILIDYLPPTPLDESNYMGHVAFGLSQSCVDTTIVNGAVLMEEKQLSIDIDEREVTARSAEQAKKLWKRF